MGFSLNGNNGRPQTPQFVPARFGAPLEGFLFKNPGYDY